MKAMAFMTGALASALVSCALVSGAAEASPAPPEPPVPSQPPPATETALASKTFVSPWVNQVLKLARAGVDDSVVLAFVDSAGSFSITSDQVVALQDEGVSADVIAAMLNHDTQIRAGLLPTPAPPPGEALPMLKKLPPLPPVPTPKPAPKSEAPTEVAQSIVNPSPAPELSDLMNLAWPTDPRPDIARTSAEFCSAAGPAQPVRAPQAVQLTDTIRIYRGAWKTPNVQVLEMFPGD